MSIIDQSGTFGLGDRSVKRLGYGAMQLAGSGVFGPPARSGCRSSLCCAKRSPRGVNHIDTSDFYGPHVTNQFDQARRFHPYPD